MPASDPLVWLLLAPTLAYAAGIVGVAAWRRRAAGTEEPLIAHTEVPRAAILVAARNEEETLPRCLEALLAQDYPPGRLAIYVADDHSTDGTAAVVRRFQKRLRNRAAIPAGDPDNGVTDERRIRLHLVAVPEPDGSLRGKALAVDAAIEASSEELLLMTDADCAPAPSWARTMAAYLADETTGVITAETAVVHPAGPSNTLAAVQALDWRYLLSCSAFLIENGLPITAMGNNMAFRREAYEAVGGYQALPFSVTEDYLLFKTIVEKTRWRARFPLDERLTVSTLPLERLGEVYAQRKRWGRGGLRAPASSYLLYAGAYLAHLLPLVILLVATVPALIALLLKSGADLLLLRSAGASDRDETWRAFPLWQLYLFYYMCTLPVALLLSPRIKWKDRRL